MLFGIISRFVRRKEISGGEENEAGTEEESTSSRPRTTIIDRTGYGLLPIEMRGN